MAKRIPILIACPQYQRLVRGDYDCDEAGNYLPGPDGQFALAHTHCRQYGGRCMQTLCVLHRHNRGGTSSWFPEKILAAPEKKHTTRSPRPRPPAPGRGESSTDLLC